LARVHTIDAARGSGEIVLTVKEQLSPPVRVNLILARGLDRKCSDRSTQADQDATYPKDGSCGRRFILEDRCSADSADQTDEPTERPVERVAMRTIDWLDARLMALLELGFGHARPEVLQIFGIVSAIGKDAETLEHRGMVHVDEDASRHALRLKSRWRKLVPFFALARCERRTVRERRRCPDPSEVWPTASDQKDADRQRTAEISQLHRGSAHVPKHANLDRARPSCL
jgi:hypothetical protein